MIIEELLVKRKYTKYRLAVQAGIPHATLSDICSGKTRIEKCSAETVYRLAKVLNVPMELLTEDGIRQAEREKAYELGLPEYLQQDLLFLQVKKNIQKNDKGFYKKFHPRNAKLQTDNKFHKSFLQEYLQQQFVYLK